MEKRSLLSSLGIVLVRMSCSQTLGIRTFCLTEMAEPETVEDLLACFIPERSKKSAAYVQNIFKVGNNLFQDTYPIGPLGWFSKRALN